MRAGQNKAEQLPEITLPEPLAGTPAVVGDALLLPLAEGTGKGRLCRQPLDGSVHTDGPGWRAHGADVGARGFVVALPEGEFLTTDGRDGLTRWRWPAEMLWQKKADATHRGGRIISVPVVVPEKDASRVAVADAAGITLYDLDLKPVRRWDHLGPVTAGPFRRDLSAGPRLGCVVGGTKLVWIDPALDTPVATFDVGHRIVGEPELAGADLAVAGADGWFGLVDPETGAAAGPGCEVEASVVPVAAPVSWGPGRVFAPLSDGTALLLPATAPAADRR